MVGLSGEETVDMLVVVWAPRKAAMTVDYLALMMVVWKADGTAVEKVASLVEKMADGWELKLAHQKVGEKGQMKAVSLV